MLLNDDRKESSKRRPFNSYLALISGFYLILSFLILYAVSVYQLDFWKKYFYFDSYDVSNQCSYSATKTDTASFPYEELKSYDLKKIKVPHRELNVFNNITNNLPFRHIYYKCEFSHKKIEDKTGITNIHIGWVFGDQYKISLNDKRKIHAKKQDKPIIPMTLEDLELESSILEIFATRKNYDRVGLTGATPLVITSGVNKNSKIMGIETALQNIRPLFRLLPTLTLGFILFIGWQIGIKSRLLVATLFFFVMVASRNLLIYLVDFWPWDIVKTSIISRAFLAGSLLSYNIFGVELLSIYSRHSEKLIKVVIGIVATQIALYSYFSTNKDVTQYINHVTDLIYYSSSLFIIVAGYYRTKNQEQIIRKKLSYAYIIASAVFILFRIVDNSLQSYGIYTLLSSQLEIIIPLFVGVILLYHLASVQKHYEKERTKRELMQERLELGRTVQELLLPEKLSGDFYQFSYQMFHEPANQMSGDWMSIWDTQDNERRLIIGDVVGKGPQAALAVSAIASIINECQHANFTMEQCINRINKHLLDIFKGKITTTLSAAAINNTNLVKLYNCGAQGWLYYNDGKVKFLPMRSNHLGSQPEINIKSETIEQSKDMLICCFTDGCLEGSRELKALSRKISSLEDIERKDFNRVHDIIIQTGKSTVLEDDKTVLTVGVS